MLNIAVLRTFSPGAEPAVATRIGDGLIRNAATAGAD